MNEHEFLYLTTTGWKSKNPHEIEIWFVEHEGRFYLISEKRERAHWVQNIRRHSAVAFRVGDQTFKGIARAVDDDDEEELVHRIWTLMDKKYQWSTGLIVQLTAK
jgi:deazaflavin-dependent oxidoreductase (nitroreductase family)